MAIDEKLDTMAESLACWYAPKSGREQRADESQPRRAQPARVNQRKKMKAYVQLPPGWRRVKRGNLRDGDRCLCTASPMWWLIPLAIKGSPVSTYGFVIRKT